jgi:hypothetical protein
MSTEQHWLIKKAETLPLGNIFDPLATRIDKLFIAGVEAAALAPKSLPRTMVTIRDLMEAREKAHQVIENRLADTLIHREAGR